MTIKEIQDIIEEGESLKAIAQAYSEIANLKIKRIRGMVERNRYFLEEITKVYFIIKKIAEQRKIYYRKPKGIVSVVLTSNFKFYGAINSDLINFFLQTVKKINETPGKGRTDIILLGRVAIDYFKTNGIFNNLSQVLLKSDQPSTTELVNLINIIKPYNQVLVFHSRLASLLSQKPVATDITVNPTFSLENTSTHSLPQSSIGSEFKFIFEPELAKILSFFDSQILTLLLESTFLESELSRTASRFISMDSAENQANKFIDEYKKFEAHTKRSIANIQILETFATTITARKGGMI